MKTGIELITEERREQIEKHGFSIIEDAEYYQNFELLQAALFCIDQATPFGHGLKTYKNWPANWDKRFEHKILAKTELEQLAVAGAFIAARMDQIIHTQNTKS
jgi:hypothetical protein